MSHDFRAPIPDPGSGLELVIARAVTDAAFRRQLLADPRTAIRDAFGAEMPTHFRLQFIERPAAVDLLVVLPDLVGGEPDGELVENDLDHVSGGALWSWLVHVPPPPG
jgi:hypothetical protein